MILSIAALLGYPFAIKYKDKRMWLPVRALCALLAVIVLIIDVLAHYTEWWFVFGRPIAGEYTISQRLDRMEAADPLPARRKFAELINTFLNACEPDGHH